MTDRRRRQHGRLETLADVVYGVAIVLLVVEMPTPRSEGMLGASLGEFLAEHYELMIGSAVSLFLVVTYWIQNNALSGILAHTDNRHSGRDIVVPDFDILDAEMLDHRVEGSGVHAFHCYF